MSDNSISMQDVIRLFETLQTQVSRAVENSAAARESASAARDASSAAKESAASALRKVIDLEEAFTEFKEDSIMHRSMREELEQEEALHQFEQAKKKLQNISPAITKDLSTQERIEKAVKVEMSKDKINWGAIWREKVLPAVITAISVAIAMALLAVIILEIIIPGLQKIAAP